MSKMRDEFEKQWALLSHEHGKIIDSALGEYFFNAGYQAAIAAVKENGPEAWIASDCESFSFTEPPSKNWLKMAWWKPVYFLPDDLT